MEIKNNIGLYRKQSIFVFLLLIIAGLAGNRFPFSILNAHFVFGSFFAMLALQFFGLGWGIVAGFIISSYTFIAWNHPWAVITMTAEVVIVGLLYRNRKMSLPFSDILYWLFIGIPVGYLCFHIIADFPVSNTLFLMTKQAVNGIANCLAARLVYFGIAGKKQSASITFREIVSSLLAFFVLTTALIFLTVNSKSDFSETNRSIRSILDRDIKNVSNSVTGWIDDRKLAITNLAELAETLPPDKMQSRLELARASDPNFIRIALVDEEATVIACSPLLDSKGDSAVGTSYKDRPHYAILKKSLKPMLSDVIVSRLSPPDPIAIMLVPVVVQGDFSGFVGGVVNFDRILETLQMSSYGQNILFSLLDRNGNVIISNRRNLNSGEPFSRGKGQLKALDGSMKQFIPSLPYLTSTIQLWGKSVYAAEANIGGVSEWRLILEQPVEPFQKNLYDRYSDKFSLIFFIVIISLSISEFIARRIHKSIEHLAVLTIGLPDQLLNNQPIEWPETPVSELNRIVENFKDMSYAFRLQFDEIRNLNRTLEGRVEEKTRELKESEEKFRNFFEASNIGKSITLPTGELYANNAFAEMLGYAKEELQNKTWRMVTPSEDIESINATLAPLRSGKKDSARFTKRYIHKNGSFIWADVSTVLQRGEDGEPFHYITSIVDITERTLAEKKLIETESRYRKLFENMTAGFVLFEVVLDDKGSPVDLIVIAGNKGFEIATGLKMQDMTGKRLTHVLPGIENDAADWIGTYGKIAMTGNALHFEQDSELLGYYYAVMAYQAGPKQCAVTFTDITTRKKAEMERERLLTAIEQTDDMVIITAPDGKIQYINPAFESLTGYSRAEVLGQNPRLLKSGKQDRAFYSDLWATISSGKVWKGRMVNKRKDGTLFTEESTISPVKNAGGQVLNFVVVKRDITEKIRISEEKDRLEKQFLQAQKMELVGRLAGGVAHDYNNMLSIISGYTEMAFEKIDREHPLYPDLQEIDHATNRSIDITRQLLAFSRQQAIAPKRFDINETVGSMLKMLRRLVGEDIDLAWHPGLQSCPVLMDPSQLDQILVNLCVNARDAIEDVGKIIIETDIKSFDDPYCAEHAGFIPGNFVMISVSDDGCGFDRETQLQIFEPFFTTKELGKGTGLGLATVYGIIKQNNGFINVYSEPGKGTTFRIYLPLNVTQAEKVEMRAEVQADASGNETILLVEDEKTILIMMEMMLETLGYKILTANKPNDAINIALEHTGRIDLMITDVVMPDMNGKELSARLKEVYPELKVLFMSGYTANVIAHHGVLEKGVNFIQKPCSKQDLSFKVRETLGEIKRYVKEWK